MLPNFSLDDVRALYLQHTAATEQQFADEALAYAYYLTQGQPWLVNALAYQACFRDVKDRSVVITKEVIERAKEALILRRDTHIDALVDRLQEPRVSRIIDAIISGQSENLLLNTDDIQYVRDLGLIKPKSYEIANPIYQEVLPRALNKIMEERIPQTMTFYLNADGSIAMHKLLEAFTQFYRENGGLWLRDFEASYKESGPHLLFMAHKATLDAGGTTVAVLGSGLLEPYPSQNIKLFETIAQTGAVVSAFPLTMEGLPGNFPARNRIIAGLSRGTVVVAAARKSGALITARYALDQGREVFAVPGHIDDELSLGCHDLIKQGAVLVSEVADIVREFGFDVDLAPEVTPVKNGDKAAQGSILSHSSEEKLSEHPILRYCKEPCSMEDLLGTAGMEYSQLVQHLFDLQIEGRVEQTAAGLWQALF